MSEEWFEFLKRDYVQGFPKFCGFEVDLVAPGRFQTRVALRPDYLQQDGFGHAGLIATLADHTAGYAAYTTVTPDYRILTVEFKINFFKPARGESLICRARVINGGKKIIVSESEVFAFSSGDQTLISKAMVTLAVVPAAKFNSTD
ncbi:MAG: PaaI family thioesterase [Deltaproteobacteria bacterium]|nr:PaaI family thioesterase [Deltaproteobacteria bacterium]